jgi:hypothetical protein
MVGDQADFVSRLWAVLPKRWFAEQSPNLEALLGSIAAPWAWLYGLIKYVTAQTRLATATEQSLDLIANDFFGSDIGRKAGESDDTYRARIQGALLREAATRSAVSAGLASVVGSDPIIFEPAKCSDTGSYGAIDQDGSIVSTGMAYGQAGGWGSLQLPFQFFVTVTRPATAGVAMLAGYGTPNGGFGQGAMSYIDISLLPGEVGDAEIQATLSSLLPVNVVAWLKIV